MARLKGKAIFGPMLERFGLPKAPPRDLKLKIPLFLKKSCFWLEPALGFDFGGLLASILGAFWDLKKRFNTAREPS